MNVLFSADWHIKIGQKNVPVEWAKNRYKSMFSQIHAIESTVDLHVIGGDIFDKLPNMEELELYYEYVAGAKCRTIIFPGNHESVKKNTTFLSFLKSVTQKLNSLVTIIDDYYTIGNMDFIPYNRLKEFEQSGNTSLVGNILFTHVRGEIPPHVKPEVDLDIFDKWEVVLAGDLHSHSNSQRNILYPGSPCTTSFHRSEVETGVIIINSEDANSWKFHKLELPQLIRKSIVAGEEMPKTDYHHTIYEVSGDMEDLSKIENSDLLDKKVVKKATEVALILEPDMTIIEELKEYLEFILELEPDKIEPILKLYAENEKDIAE